MYRPRCNIAILRTPGIWQPRVLRGIVRHRCVCLLAIAVAVINPFSAGRENIKEVSGCRPYKLEWDVKIPLRDGVLLNATIYRPIDQRIQLPIILLITPYVSDRFHDVASFFAEHGYIFAAVDTRGRGNSDGEFIPWMREADDGFDVVTCFGKQPYCDGQVAMWGGSYSGKNQWAVAGRGPSALRTIAPASAGYVAYDMGMLRNIPFTSL
jgi:uncharacterized protein